MLRSRGISTQKTIIKLYAPPNHPHFLILSIDLRYIDGTRYYIMPFAKCQEWWDGCGGTTIGAELFQHQKIFSRPAWDYYMKPEAHIRHLCCGMSLLVLRVGPYSHNMQ
jgi:hypothetical protein